MKTEQIERVEKALIDFIERATKENATDAEIAALPQVALSLAEINRL